MKQVFWCSIIIGLLLCLNACSKSMIANVLDDISRDTYKNNVNRQRIENLGEPAYEEPPAYNQYQREREELKSDRGKTSRLDTESSDEWTPCLEERPATCCTALFNPAP